MHVAPETGTEKERKNKQGAKIMVPRDATKSEGGMWEGLVVAKTTLKHLSSLRS